MGTRPRRHGRVDTDCRRRNRAGITGCGESCAIYGIQLGAFPEGVPVAPARLAPVLIGEDPRQLHRIERVIDGVLIGQGTDLHWGSNPIATLFAHHWQ